MIPDSDELLAASFFRNKRFAEWFVATLVLAVEAEPELVRNALSKAFDYKRIERDHEEIMRRTLLARQDLDQLRQESQLLKDQLDELRKTVARSQEFLTNGKHSGPRVRG